MGPKDFHQNIVDSTNSVSGASQLVLLSLSLAEVAMLQAFKRYGE